MQSRLILFSPLQTHHLSNPLSIAASHASLPMIKLLFSHGGFLQYGLFLQYAVKRNASDRFELIDFLATSGTLVKDWCTYQNRHTRYCQQRSFGLRILPQLSTLQKKSFFLVEIITSALSDAQSLVVGKLDPHESRGRLSWIALPWPRPQSFSQIFPRLFPIFSWLWAWFWDLTTAISKVDGRLHGYRDGLRHRIHTTILVGTEAESDGSTAAWLRADSTTYEAERVE